MEQRRNCVKCGIPVKKDLKPWESRFNPAYCPDCFEERKNMDDKIVTRHVKCGACSGTGKIKGYTCQACDGKGEWDEEGRTNPNSMLSYDWLWFNI